MSEVAGRGLQVPRTVCCVAGRVGGGWLALTVCLVDSVAHSHSVLTSADS